MAFGAIVLAIASIRAQSPADNNWTTYSGSLSSHRFSPLQQLTPSNVTKLKPVWVYQPPGVGTVETTPLVVNNVMYATWGPTGVAALDVRSGKTLWEWTRPIAASVLNLGFPRVNRGVAFLDNTLYVGTLDGFLVALDSRSGAEKWTVHVGENPLGHSITAAPLAVEGKVIVGISGGEAGIRGFLDAYDAKTGKLLWRFWTVPSPGEPGSNTWPGDSWVHGGGATWLTGSYDPELKLLYWGTGNPGPDWNGDSRAGDNSTRRRWWRSTWKPAKRSGISSTRRTTSTTGIRIRFRCWSTRSSAVGRGSWWRWQTATRSSTFSIARNGEYLLGAQYAKQTWAKGLDEKGRPILIPDMEPSEKGTLVYPSLQGATNWASPSYSPSTGLMYVPVREMGSVYFKTPVEDRPGTYYTGGSEKRLDEESWGAVRAIDVKTGKQAWDFALPSPTWAGVLSTAGGLVFSGSNEGNFYALDAKTGKALWQFQTGGLIRSGPMSFGVDGKQHVAVASGRAIFVFGFD